MLNPMVLLDLVTYRGVTIVILFLQPTNNQVENIKNNFVTALLKFMFQQ